MERVGEESNGQDQRQERIRGGEGRSRETDRQRGERERHIETYRDTNT